MKLVVKLFAYLREIIGKRKIELNLPSVSSLANVLEALIHHFPQLKEVLFVNDDFSPEIIIALNGNHIPKVKFDEIILCDGDELAFLPPFGGGKT